MNTKRFAFLALLECLVIIAVLSLFVIQATAAPQWPNALQWASAGASEDQLWAATTPPPSPTVITQPSDIVPGAAPFDTNGLSFTNVSFKIGIGMELQNAGTFSYAQADWDAWNLGSVDIGLGTELTFSTAGNGIHSGAVGPELIKNFTNWQLVGKVFYGRIIENNTGNYLKLGFDLNYNLAEGTGLTFLSSAKGSFTYVGAGVSWANANFQLNNAERDVRIYLGWAF